MNDALPSIEPSTVVEGPPRRVALHTLGCKLNYAETSAIGERFRRQGYSLVEFGAPSEVILINSCTVTEGADRECRQLVRRALRANPNAFVIVTGCYAQLQPEEIASIDGVDLVLGTAEKFRVFELERDFRKREVPRVEVAEVAGSDFGPAFTGTGDVRTRAFLKVQDGCDYSCAFCTIPRARGASRSQPVADAVRQARELVASGYREIVLTGVNVGEFGRKEGTSLRSLLEALHEVDGLRRLRISSIEPNLITDEIIDLASRSDRIAPHFHVPLQSGSNRVLGMMRRRYRAEVYRDRIERIFAALPSAGIGADVIVGFPGEGAAEFGETVEFIESLPVSYLHVFTYSERRQTPAAAFKGVVPVEERRRRTGTLRVLSERKSAAFAMRWLGTICPVLFEGVEREGMVEGWTDNYVRVAMPFDPALCGTVAPVRLESFDGRVVQGTVVH